MYKKLLMVTVLSISIFAGCTNNEVQENGSQVDEISNESTIEATEDSATNLYDYPDGIQEVPAETEKYPELEEVLIEYYEIPEDFWATTKYYYNYVDLNDDGVEEIFVVAMGPYTSGTGGDSALIVYPVEGELHVNQAFTLMNTPIIISDKQTNGAKEIIVERRGGGAERAYVSLTCSDGVYTGVNEGQVLENLEGIEGRAIIANVLLKDLENGTVLKLKE